MQVWATKCLVLIYKAAVSMKSLEKPQNFENQQHIKPPHCPEIKVVSQVISTQGLKQQSQQQNDEKIQQSFIANKNQIQLHKENGLEKPVFGLISKQLQSSQRDEI